MQTQCSTTPLEFAPLGSRLVEGAFDGGTITTDAGGLLLREADRGLALVRRVAECFEDYRDPERIEFTVAELVGQRIFGLALGYEDLNDHDTLRRDPLLAVLVGKLDVTGQQRARARDRGQALAGKSTLNRLELTPAGADERSRYQKIGYDEAALDRLLVALFVEAQAQPPAEIILDLDATDDPVHGNQEGRFFHGYYRSYCYLPLYVFCGEHLLCARLRTADRDAAAGATEEVARIVDQVRAVWPAVRIIVRGDSGFAREELMSWCEGAGVDYVLGLARNNRLEEALAGPLEQARRAQRRRGGAVRYFRDFQYRTRTSWSRTRRVVGKAEQLAQGPNPRFVVTSLPRRRIRARRLYERLYCGRGEMENRIKEQQLWLFADRTSTARLRANQLRLLFSSLAYVLVMTVRRVGLRGTGWERAQVGTIRTGLLKLGALVRVSVRRVRFAFSSGCPQAALFRTVLANLQTAYPLRQ